MVPKPMSWLQSLSAWLASVLHACTMWCRGAPVIDLPKHRVHIVKQLADGATGIVYLAQDNRKRQFALYASVISHSSLCSLV
jgi:hypothetical protein